MILHYVKPHYLPTLHDAICAALPAVAPEDVFVCDDYTDAVDDGSGGNVVAAPIADGIRVVLPDGTDQTIVDGVVAAHDPTPPPAPESTSAKVATALAAIENDPSLADNVKQALTNVVQALS